MSINKLTIGQLSEISRFLDTRESNVSKEPYPFKIGDKLFIRTATHQYTGRVKSIRGHFLTLEKAAWIVHTGRLYDALKDTNFNEIEPFINDLIVNMQFIVDATTIDGDLPSEQL